VPGAVAESAPLERLELRIERLRASFRFTWAFHAREVRFERNSGEGWQRACDHLVGGGQADSEVIPGVHDAARQYEDVVIGERIPLTLSILARPFDPQVERPLRWQHGVARPRQRLAQHVAAASERLNVD